MDDQLDLAQTKVIVNTVEAAPHHPWYVMVVRTDFLKENRDAVVRAVDSPQPHDAMRRSSARPLARIIREAW